MTVHNHVIVQLKFTLTHYITQYIMGELDSPGVSLIHILKIGPSSLCTHNLTSSLTDLDFFWVGKKERRERERRENLGMGLGGEGERL
jgi:hypothetical protein